MTYLYLLDSYGHNEWFLLCSSCYRLTFFQLGFVRSRFTGMVVFNYKDCNNTLQKTEGESFSVLRQNSMSLSVLL